MYRHIFFISFLCFAVLHFGSAQSRKSFEITDYKRLVTLSDPQFSPDGKNIALVVSRPDIEKNRFTPEIAEVEVKSGLSKVLVSGYESVSQPRYSPDSRYLSFVAKAASEGGGKSQIFLLSLKGNQIRQLTSSVTGVLYYSWSPDASRIAFTAQDEPANKDLASKGYTAFEVLDNDMFLESAPNPAHIWLAEVESGSQRRITSGTWSLPVVIPPSAPAPALSWAPGGDGLLFVKVPSAYSGDNTKRRICRLSVSSGLMDMFTGVDSYESFPLFSPDARWVSYWKRRNDDSEDLNELHVSPAAGGRGRSVSFKLDRDLYRSVWFPDGKKLLVGGHDENRTSLWTFDLDGNVKKLSLGNICPSWYFWTETAISGSGSIAFLGSTPDHPAELFFMASPESQPVPLTQFNREVAEMELGKMETIRWQTDGWSHCGILTYPVQFDAGKKYPLVLVIHGGPFAASVEQFVRFSQVLSNKGFFVFEPNYRGSDNMGSAYKLAIVEDAGAGPGRDIMDGLARVKTITGIDSARIGVSGWSYGGFLTVWLAGHYGGWKAAVPGASVTDLNDQYNLSDYNVNRASAMRGSPWRDDNMRKYVEQSPITRAGNIKAPTLILGNTGDPRVPIGQSYKLYHALKDNGTPVKFIAWPVKAHNATDPITQMERDRYWLEWMERYLK